MPSQLKIAIRTNYSNPPIHGGAVVAAVLNNPELRALWEKGTGRNARAHQGHAPKLVDGLKAAGVTKDMSFITTQIGMFSYSGLSKDQMVRLRNEFGVYGTGHRPHVRRCPEQQEHRLRLPKRLPGHLTSASLLDDNKTAARAVFAFMPGSSSASSYQFNSYPHNTGTWRSTPTGSPC